MKIVSLMKYPVVTCHPQDNLDRAAQLMWDHDCGCVPVVDAAERITGMITDRDVCMAAYTQGKALSQLRVQDAMASTVYGCRADDQVSDAERMMRLNQLHRLPVVDGEDRVIGIVSLNDIAHAAQRRGDKSNGAVTFAEVGETLKAVCKPRFADC